MIKKYTELTKKLPGVKADVLLAGHTTFKIGGPADLFYEANTTDKIIQAVKLARRLKIPYFILGEGSNLLISDQGFKGLVIKIQTSEFKLRNSNIIADGGVKLKTLVEETAKVGLFGLEFVAGIPGTLGGAVRGNAGAWQQNIGDRVLKVRVLTEKGEIKWLNQKNCQFKYRQSRFKKTSEIILEVELQLGKGVRKEISKKIKKILKKREIQPKELSAGCIFINPKPLSAGKLIEGCGLKGRRIGDAQISPQHANFIVNLGQARAKDVLQLIKLAKTKVQKKFGVRLEKEIYLLGFDKI
ncbi:MAG TPA: UDP-N-acetylmuramate dehydrogenase [Nevskiaceae bacterium]|nr:UDP-N-acetylmuramate dehydrogenase [Nevskiaceae bacterium]